MFTTVIETHGAFVSDTGTIFVECVGIVVTIAFEGALKVETCGGLMTVVKTALAFVDVNKHWGNADEDHLETWIWSTEMSRSSIMAVGVGWAGVFTQALVDVGA